MRLRFYSVRITVLCLGFIFGLFSMVVTAAAGTYTLSVGKTGDGNGTVRSSISGIDCGGTCSFAFPGTTPPRVITLTAVPDPGSYFNGWSGNCTGQALTCKVIMNGGQTVNADFTTTAPVITPWVKTITSAGSDGASEVKQTSDGGYIVAGKINNQFAAVKLSANGSIDWQRIYTVSAGNASSVDETSDGGYILAGSQWDGSGGMTTVPFITKVDGADGHTVWQKYVYEYFGDISSVRQVSDGSFVVAGPSQLTSSSSSSYFWIGKIAEFTPPGGSLDADLTWGKTYESGGGSNSIIATPDGGFIASGANSEGGLVIKLDSVGDSDVSVDWQYNYGGVGAGPISVTSDAGYVMIATTLSGTGVTKLNSDGTIAWQKIYTTSGNDQLNSVQETYDGNFVVAGGKEMSGGTTWTWDIWVLKLDASGEVLWQKTYGKSTSEMANSIQQIADGGYIVAAGPYGSAPADTDAMWVLKLDPNGNVLGCSDAYATNVTGTATDNNATKVATTLVQSNGTIGIASTSTPWSGLAGGTLADFCSGTGPMLSISPSSPFDFGSAALNGTVSQPFILSNIGNATLNLSDLWTATGMGFSFNVNGGGMPCGSEAAAISAGDSCSVLINFSPSTLGLHSSELYIYSTNPGPWDIVTLNGTGEPGVAVIPSGTGNGNVSGDSINCTWNGTAMSGGCSIITGYSAVSLNLTASAGACSFFNEWSSLCSGSDPACSVTTTGTAGAGFDLYPLAWSGSYQTGGYPTISDTYTNAGSGLIYVQAYSFDEDLVFTKAIDVSFDAGWNCDFTWQSGDTVVKSLTVSRGSVTLENGSFIIR